MDWHWVLAAIAGAAVLRWIAAPLAVHRTLRQPAKPEVRQLGPDGPELPETVANSFKTAAASLEPAGFETAGALHLPGLTGRVSGFALVLTNRRERVMALVSTLTARTPTGRKSFASCEFVTRYRDDSAVLTTNSDRLRPVGPKRPSHVVAQLPAVRDAARLYRIHRRRLERSKKDSGTAFPLDERYQEDVAAYVAGNLENEMQRQAAAGWLRLSPDLSAFQPTWKAAILWSWTSLWPAGMLRRTALRRKEREILRELGD